MTREGNAFIKSGSTLSQRINTLFWKMIGIQYCDRIGVRINLEDATIGGTWNIVHHAAISHGTFIPLPSFTEVRSDVSDGFVDWIEFDRSMSIERNAIEGPLLPATFPQFPPLLLPSR